MAQKVSAGVPGSHRDATFQRQAAKIAGKGRRPLFTSATEISLSGSGSSLEMFSRQYAGAIFKTPGDAICFEVAGYFAGNVNNKQIHLTIESENGIPVSSFDSLVESSGSIVFFNLKASVYLSDLKRLGKSLVYTTSAAGQQVLSTLAGANYLAKKINIILGGTGGAAGDVLLQYARAEFIPAAIT